MSADHAGMERAAKDFNNAITRADTQFKKVEGKTFASKKRAIKNLDALNVVEGYRNVDIDQSIIDEMAQPTPLARPVDNAKYVDPADRALSDPNVAATHTTEEISNMRNYVNSTDKNIVELAKRVRSGEKIEPYEVKVIDDRMAADLKAITGMKSKGRRVLLTNSSFEHIDNRHGLNGIENRSMADDNSLGRIKYVLDNYDEAFKPNPKDSTTSALNTSANKPDPKAVFTKKIDGQYYVVVATSDTKKGNDLIVSAYIDSAESIEKQIASGKLARVADAVDGTPSSPLLTSDTGHAAAADIERTLSKSNVPPESENVNLRIKGDPTITRPATPGEIVDEPDTMVKNFSDIISGQDLPDAKTDIPELNIEDSMRQVQINGIKAKLEFNQQMQEALRTERYDGQMLTDVGDVEKEMMRLVGERAYLEKQLAELEPDDGLSALENYVKSQRIKANNKESAKTEIPQIKRDSEHPIPPDNNIPQLENMNVSQTYTNTGRYGGGWNEGEYANYTDPRTYQYETISERESVEAAQQMRAEEGREVVELLKAARN